MEVSMEISTEVSVEATSMESPMEALDETYFAEVAEYSTEASMEDFSMGASAKASIFHGS